MYTVVCVSVTLVYKEAVCTLRPFTLFILNVLVFVAEWRPVTESGSRTWSFSAAEEEETDGETCLKNLFPLTFIFFLFDVETSPPQPSLTACFMVKEKMSRDKRQTTRAAQSTIQQDRDTFN